MRTTINQFEFRATDLRDIASEYTCPECAGYEIDGVYTEFLYLPTEGRGAVATNADAVWTDASSMQDLEDRWANDEMCN